MRRVIVVFGVAVLFVLPSAVFAVTRPLVFTRTLHGQAGPVSDSSIDIAFRYSGHHAHVIRRLEMNNIPVTCLGGRTSATYYKFRHHIPVSSKSKFSATESTNGASYHVQGQFTGVHKAAGSLHITGTVPGCSGANSGVVHWSATPAAHGQ